MTTFTIDKDNNIEALAEPLSPEQQADAFHLGFTSQKELAELEGELKALLEKDLATIQLAAKRLDLPFVVVKH